MPVKSRWTWFGGAAGHTRQLWQRAASTKSLSVSAVVLAMLVAASSARCAETSPPLSALIGDEVALYLEVPSVDDQSAAWDRSELARRFRASSLATLLSTSDIIRQWRSANEAVLKTTHKSLTEHVQGLCGEGLALAVFVPPSGPPEGMWLSRARSSAVLDETLKAWERIEPALLVKQQTATGAEYVARVVTKGAAEQRLYFVQRDDVFVLSDREPLVAACADRLADWKKTAATVGERRATPAFVRHMTQLAPDQPNAVAWLYCQPRAWDRLLNSELDASPPAQMVRSLWGALNGIGVTLRFEPGPTLTIAASMDPAAVDPAWTAALRTVARESTAGLPSILDVAPENAVAVAGGSFAPGWFHDRFRMVLTPQEQAEWKKMDRVLRGICGGRDPWHDVAAAAFQDWGMVITHRSSPRLRLWLSDWSFATVHQLARGDDRASVAEVIDDVLHFALNVFAVDQNSHHEEETVAAVRLNHGEWRGWRLSGRIDRDMGFLTRGNRLVTAMPSEDAIRLVDRFATPSSAGPAGPAGLRELAAEEFPAASLFAWVDAAGVRHAFGFPAVSATRPWPLFRPEGLHDLRAWGPLFDQAFAAFTFNETRLEVKFGGRHTSSSR